MRPAAVNPQNLTGKALRGALLAKGYTIEAFAQEHEFRIGTVRAVVSGRRGSRGQGKSAEIRRAIQSAISP